MIPFFVFFCPQENLPKSKQKTMSKHSKNPSTRPYLSSHERSLLATSSGQLSVRLNAFSHLPFSFCSLCASEAIRPVTCSLGHLFCKSCVVDRLDRLGQERKAKQKIYEEQMEKERKKSEEEREMREREKRERFVEFEVHGNGIGNEVGNEVWGSGSGVLVVSNRVGRDAVDLVVDGRKVEDEKVKEVKDKHMPSFWLPEKAPDNVESKVEKPDECNFCSEAKHVLRLKHLVPVIWTMVQDMEGRDARGVTMANDNRFMCPACSKSFNNASKISHLRRCGHAVCSTCADAFVKKDLACMVCGKQTSLNDVVQMQVGGSGFSGGSKKLITSIDTPAFR